MQALQRHLWSQLHCGRLRVCQVLGACAAQGPQGAAAGSPAGRRLSLVASSPSGTDFLALWCSCCSRLACLGVRRGFRACKLCCVLSCQVGAALSDFSLQSPVVSGFRRAPSTVQTDGSGERQRRVQHLRQRCPPQRGRQAALGIRSGAGAPLTVVQLTSDLAVIRTPSNTSSSVRCSLSAGLSREHMGGLADRAVLPNTPIWHRLLRWHKCTRCWSWTAQLHASRRSLCQLSLGQQGLSGPVRSLLQGGPRAGLS